MPAPISLDELRRNGQKVAEIEGYLPSSYPRYVDWEDIKEPEVIQYVVPEAIHDYSLVALRAYTRVLANHGAIPKDSATEIGQRLTRANVPFRKQQEWEHKLRHDIRGLIRACQEVLSEQSRRWLYIGLTSYDVINTAWSLALRDVSYEVLVPRGIQFSKNLLGRAKLEKSTLMIGRTHKQHAATTTVGHWLMEILGGFMPPLMRQLDYASDLRGKTSGFVGTRAAQKLLFGNAVHPRNLENETLSLLYLKPDPLTGQVVHQSYYVQYFANLVSLAGNVAKFAEDVRNFQQTEVSEVFEQRLSQQVGSSTGAHKRNPIDSENIGGHWRQILPKLVSVYEDFITDFQRDLRNSANLRYYGSEIPFITGYMIRKGATIAEKMTIRKDRMAHNIGMTQGLILGEPLQLTLQVFCAKRGLDLDTHEYVRKLANKAQEEGIEFWKVIKEDALVNELLSSLDKESKETLLSPEKYLGTVEEDVSIMVEEWEKQLLSLEEQIDKHSRTVKYS